MTLVEVMVAFVVLMLVLVPTGILLSNVMRQAGTARARLTALSLAERCIETLNNGGPTLSQGLPETNATILEDARCFGTGATTAISASTIAYKVHAEFRWTTAQGTVPDLCTAGSVPTVMDLSVWVTWGHHTTKVTDTTVMDYPPPGLPTDGFLAVQLHGSPSGAEPADHAGRPWATRVQGVVVKISSSGFTATLHPNSAGCVFEQVPPGSYSVTATAAGWAANQNEAATATRSAQTVSIGTVTLVTLQYDEGALVSLGYPSTTATEGGVSCPHEGSIDCLVFGQAPSNPATPGKTPVAELSVLASTQKWTVSKPTGVVRLASVACAGTTRCIAVGYEKSGGAYAGASISSGTAPAPHFTADPVPSGVKSLSGITCPSGTRCYAYGLGSSGAVILSGAVSTTSVSWTNLTITTVPARISAVACRTATSCYALGTKSSSTLPVVLSLTGGTKWIPDTLPATTTYAPSTLSQIACPGTSTCFATGTRKASTLAGVVSPTATTTKKWVKDSVPGTVTSLATLTCPSAGVCYATGTRKTGTTTYGAIVSLSTGSAWNLDAPATDASITGLSCPSTQACVAIGANGANGPLVAWRTSATTFTAEALPSSVTSIYAVACGSASHCFVAGDATVSGTTAAVLLSGSSTAWTQDSLPAVSPVFFSGVACGGTLCVAPGASETGALYLDGTPTGTGWTAASPPVTEGMVVGDAPIAVTNTGLMTTRPLEVVVPTGTADAGQIGPLFPFQSGYTVAASECAPMQATASVTSVPGATVAATLPMGLLSIEAVNAYGNPDTSATIAASPTCGTKLTPPTGQTNPTSFTLEQTGPLGWSQTAVIYGTYNVTVTHGSSHATRTLTVTPTGITVSGTTVPLATPVVVTVT